MPDDIFLIQNDGKLVELSEQTYDSEALLQGLLADYPKLLAGGQMDSSSPRRWLLIKREMGVPSKEEGGGRWSVDHLFLDQDAVPTLVEVKRSTDTRLRREVVGQMLDYAANAVVYWPVEQIRAEFEAGLEDVEDELSNFLGEEGAEEFWQKVKTNLQAGKIRMVFVADVIPTELRRIVEFLNEQMDPAEVLAVEIKQFVGEGMKTLVPRVMGQTAKRKPPRGTKRIDEEARLAFWTAFHQKVMEEAPQLRPDTPTSGPNLPLTVDLPGVSVLAVADGNAKRLLARLVIRGADAVAKGEPLKQYVEEHPDLLRESWRCHVAGRGGSPRFVTSTERSFSLAEDSAEQHRWLLGAIREVYEKLLPVLQAT